MGVSAKNEVATAQGRDEHQQRALWEMKIGEHRADDPELVSGINEEVGFAGAGLDVTGASGIFEGADRSSADGDDAAVFVKRSVYGFGGGVGDLIRLTVQLVPLDDLFVDGLKGAEADVE